MHKNRSRWRDKCRAIDSELERGEAEVDIEVQVDVGSTRCSNTRSSSIDERVKVGFNQWVGDGRCGCRVHIRRMPVPQNGRVYATSKALGANVGLCSNPIVANGLVGV